MNVPRWVTVLALTSLTGCGLYESLVGIPTATAIMRTPSATSVNRVFQCAETGINQLATPNSFWRSDVTRRNPGEGVLETGDFGKANVGGFRARITFDRRNNEVRINLKGAGAYYEDIGVEKSVLDLKGRMQACLQADS